MFHWFYGDALGATGPFLLQTTSIHNSLPETCLEKSVNDFKVIIDCRNYSALQCYVAKDKICGNLGQKRCRPAGAIMSSCKTDEMSVSEAPSRQLAGRMQNRLCISLKPISPPPSLLPPPSLSQYICWLSIKLNRNSSVFFLLDDPILCDAIFCPSPRFELVYDLLLQNLASTTIPPF